VTSKGQITIPAEIRQHLGVREGDKLRMTVESDGRVVIRRVEVSIRQFAGILGKPRRSLTLEEIDEAIADAAVERFRRATKE
jgi:AbrB family looped-hinge helix DNA binding protein